MQVAHIILAHKNPEQLRQLVKSLYHTDSYIYIHIDLKSDISDFDAIKGCSNVYFVKKRVSVHWGGFSQVRAVLNSMSEVIEADKPFLYVNLLSGQDYPVRKLKDFYKYLSDHPRCAFMEYIDDTNSIWLNEAHNRLSQYHFTDLVFPGKYKIQKIVNAILPKRNEHANFQIVGRSQWFTVDIDSVRYILDFVKREKDIVAKFKFSWGADELFFQSILYNSPLKSRLINNNLRYIDWSDGSASPKTLTLSDLKKIELSDCFFARKFEAKPEVLNYIDQNILC